MRLLIIVGVLLILVAAPFWFVTMDNYLAYSDSLYAQEQHAIQCANESAFCWGLGFHLENARYHSELALENFVIALPLSAVGAILLTKGGAFGKMKKMIEKY